jgi:cell division septation protein DedD
VQLTGQEQSIMMRMGLKPLWAGALAATLLAGAAPALADVKSGVDAWTRGDYSAAVREWEAPAAAGDADAMFNLGQAFRLGRGVPADAQRAEALYARAAAAGHMQAADTYGLMLFQDGRRDAALPYLQDAARRGDPRSQYLLGIAHFNGDLLPRDPVRAYALVTMANSAGLPQAASAIRQMDDHIPLTQRQQAAGLAVQMQQDASAARARDLAAVDLGAQASAPGPGATRPVDSPAMRPPQPLATAAVSPSVSAARAAIIEATGATGTESPAQAGASFARGPAPASSPSPGATPTPTAAPTRTPTPTPTPTPAARPAARPAAAPAAASGTWRVQLGAFSVAGNADALWQRLSSRSELAGRQKLKVAAGRVTKLQAGDFPTRASAEQACRTLAASGNPCLVTDR